MLAFLKPGNAPLEKETKSYDEVASELKRYLPTLLASFPYNWACSLNSVIITPGVPPAKHVLEIGLYFKRSDIGDIYKATKLLFDITKEGKTNADLKSLTAEIESAALQSSEFLKYVGQVWGCAWGFVENCNPPTEGYSVSIFDCNGKRFGSVNISREDGLAILTGRVNVPTDAARMYVFE